VPARRLYERAGFIERGRQPDAFRLDGVTAIEDVLMTLCLR
jgi:RimJ/RimL family protein N-acetyltransferase